jgi:hypothetical protein
LRMAAGELELDAARNVSLLLPPWEGPGSVDADLRAALAVALGAAGLSALVGIFAGVAFGWILVRAIAFGAVMGAVALGAAWLVRRVLPGLIPDRPGEGRDVDESIFSAGAPEPAVGSRVDIVLPGGEADGEAEEVEQADEPAPVGEAVEPEPRQADEISLIDEGERAGGAEAAMPAHQASAERDARPEAIDDLDVLPDLDGFTDTFAAAEFSSSGGAAAQAQARPEEHGSSRPSDGLDPASLAKAVRTILKRDQKG